MISKNNGSSNRSMIETSTAEQEDRWDRIVVQRRTFNSLSQQTVRNGVAYYSSESESEVEDSHHEQKLARYNGTLSRLSHFSETEDEGEREVGHRVKGIVDKVWTMARRLTSSVGVWIYWALVQSLVFEKWILHRKPSGMGKESPMFIPAHRCSSMALRPIPRRYSGGSPGGQFGSPPRRQVPWFLILSSLLLIPVLGALAYFITTTGKFN